MSVSVLADKTSSALCVRVTVTLTEAETMSTVTVDVVIEENVASRSLNAIIPISVGTSMASGDGFTMSSLLANKSSSALGVVVTISLASGETVSSMTMNTAVLDRVGSGSFGSGGSGNDSSKSGGSDEHYVYLN